MDKSFTERLHTWEEQTKRKLWKYWWGLLVLLVWKLLEHRVLEWANRFIDSHASFSWLMVVVSTLESTLVIVGLGVLFIVLLVAHAYWETRPNRRKIEPPLGDGWFAFNAPEQVHSHIPLELFIRNVGPRTVRNIRFDPVISRGGSKLWFSSIASLARDERVRVGFSAGERGEYVGVVNRVINFFEGGTSSTDQPACKVTIRFLDGSVERTERHIIEGHPLPKGGISLSILPIPESAAQKDKSVAPSDPQIILDYHWRYSGDYEQSDRPNVPVLVRNDGPESAINVKIDDITSGGWKAAFPPIPTIGGKSSAVPCSPSLEYDGMPIEGIQGLIALLRPSTDAGFKKSQVTPARATYSNTRGDNFAGHYEFKWDNRARECRAFFVRLEKL
jgi:hypothetical protein